MKNAKYKIDLENPEDYLYDLDNPMCSMADLEEGWGLDMINTNNTNQNYNNDVNNLEWSTVESISSTDYNNEMTKNKEKIFDIDKASEVSKILGLESNESVTNQYYFIKNITKEKTKNDKDYLKFVITDFNQDMDARIWDVADYNESADVIKVNKAKINVWNNSKQLIVTDYEMGTIDPMTVQTSFDRSQIRETIEKQINLVKDPIYRNILEYFILNNKDFWVKPAAVSHHHDYLGGLCQHSCEVASIAYDMAYRMVKLEKANINLDLILTGALMHDIGKTKLYDLEGIRPTYNSFYGLYEHLVQGVLMVREYVRDNGLYEGNEGKIALLDHIILSHHLKKEYGSPVNPQFKEAFIVHSADALSSHYNKIEKLSQYPDSKNPTTVLSLERATIFTNSGVNELYGD